MTRVSAIEERILRVSASPKRAYAFFSQPEQLAKVMAGVERCELLPQGSVRWVLEEKVDKGIRFQADYVVVYEGDGAGHIRWRSLSGNMENAGDVSIRPTADGGCEIHYRERVEPDLPISALMAKLIQPLVARELRTDISRFLDRAEQQLSGRNN
jgi:uncharacterized membrane protein